MKKNEKIVLVAIAISAGLGLLINGLNQRKKIINDPDKEFDFDEFLKSGLLLGIGGGLSAIFFLFLQSLNDKKKIDKEDFNEVLYLKNVLSSFQLDEVDKATIAKGFEIRKALYDNFKDLLLGKPTYQGSIPQGTALSGLSDLDIRVGFKKTSFATLEEMYFTVLDYFENDFQDAQLIEVRQQKRSIGLIYNLLDAEVCIDVVPGRRTNFIKGGNEYNLFENANGLFDKPSRIKMNPHKQADLGRNAYSVSKITALLKVLNEKEELPMKSVLIKELTKYAFDWNKGRLPRRIDRQLLMVMGYIRDNIETKIVFAPDNKNLILSDLLSSTQKTGIADHLDFIIQDVEKNPANFQIYFPIKEYFFEY
jgi:hypothetical protein